jgi:transcriptional regulator of met regulon
MTNKEVINLKEQLPGAVLEDKYTGDKYTRGLLEKRETTRASIKLILCNMLIHNFFSQVLTNEIDLYEDRHIFAELLAPPFLIQILISNERFVIHFHSK